MQIPSCGRGIRMCPLCGGFCALEIIARYVDLNIEPAWALIGILVGSVRVSHLSGKREQHKAHFTECDVEAQRQVSAFGVQWKGISRNEQLFVSHLQYPDEIR